MPSFTWRMSWRWIPRILATVFAALIWALGPAVPAEAHASVVAAAPLGDSLTALDTVPPGTMVRNLLLVQIQDASGDPDGDGLPAHCPGPLGKCRSGTVPVRAQASGTYQGVVVLPHPGQWRVQVGLWLDEFDNPVIGLVLAVN